MSPRWLFVLTLFVSVLAPRPAHAQAPEPITLRSGFTPDPARATGRTIGTTALRTRTPECGGFAGNRADHVIELQSAFGFFRLFVISSQDLTLAVRGTDGSWRCSTAQGDSAALLEGRFRAGRYEVWVGSPTHGSHVEYELQLTEFRSVGPGENRGGEAGGSIDVGLALDAETGRFRARRIRRGFLPDPIVDEATAGGPIDVRLLGADCRGFVEAAPSHVLTLRDEFDYLRVQLGGARGHATIVLRTPGGRYLCNAPEEGNAFVDQDAWPEGVYQIWVGSREAAARPEYRICYTEARLAEAAATCGPASVEDE